MAKEPSVVAIFEAKGERDGEPVGVLVVADSRTPDDTATTIIGVTLLAARELARRLGADLDEVG
ncbi:MAG: hypothetical protein ACXWYS_03080 [Gaiellaceae bacterium]